MRKIFLALLVVAMLFPMVSLAETPLFIDSLGLEVIVPNEWVVENTEEGSLAIKYGTSNNMILFNEPGDAVEDADMPELSADIGMLLAGVSATSSGGIDVKPVTSFDHSVDGRRIVGGVVTFTLFGEEMTMTVYMFTSVVNTWATCSYAVPTDGSIDVSWLTNALEMVFPELLADEPSIAGNTD